MSSALAALTLLLAGAGEAPAAAPRQPHPLAPSLPQLTADEEDRMDAILDRFILFDTGQLGGAEGEQALREFSELGPEAAFALVRGLNRAAAIDATCPAVTIGRKLLSIIRTSRDPNLMDFLRENIGAGVTRTVHGGILRSLKAEAALRKQLAMQSPAPVFDPTRRGPDRDGLIIIRPRRKPADPGAPLSEQDIAYLSRMLAGETASDAVAELERRDGPEALQALAQAASDGTDSRLRYLAQNALTSNLARQSEQVIRQKLADERPEIRAAAALATGKRKLGWGEELIELLGDSDLTVRMSAREALETLAGGPEHAPDSGVPLEDEKEVLRRWRVWWAKGGKPAE